MKRILVLLILMVPVLLTAQSNFNKGIRVGDKDGNRVLLDSIVEIDGATRIYYGGVAYDAVNVDSVPDADGVDGTEPLLIWDGGVYRRTTTTLLTSSTISNVTSLQTDLSDLETTVANLDLQSDFDSLILSDDLTKVYGYITLPVGQLRVVLNVDDREDNSSPTLVSAEVGGVGASTLVLTMSEYMLDSITDITGAGGGNWAQMDHAYNFDQVFTTATDLVGADNATMVGSATMLGDSLGVAGNAVYFDGDDYATITGENYGTTNFSGSMWVKIHNASTTEFFLGGTDNGAMMIGHINGGLVMGESGAGTISTATTGITLTANTWHHVAWARNYSSNNVTFWIDGDSEVETLTYDFTLATTAIGVRKVGVGGYCDALMDDLFLFPGYLIGETTVDSIWSLDLRYNESGGGETSNQDTITNAFSVLVDGVADVVTAASITSSKVHLTLTDAVTWGDVVTIAYDKPIGAGSNFGLRDTSDNYAASWAATSVTNNVDTVNYTIYEQWDFETETLGTFTEAERVTYFGNGDPDRIDHDDYHTDPEIVSITLNGSSTKALKVTNEAGYPDGIYSGLDMAWQLDTGYDELYFSYNVMIDKTFIGTKDMKLPGFEPMPSPNVDPPSPGYGFRAQAYSKQGAEMNSYFYDRTLAYPAYQGSNPHDGGTPALDSVYLIPGVWYEITIRCKKNTFSGSTPLLNGVFEIGKNGYWANQVTGLRLLEDSDMQINGVSIRCYTGGGSIPDNQPEHDFYVYFDNFTTWRPNNDDTWGQIQVHDSDVKYTSPIDITINTVSPDDTITTESAFANLEYPTAYSAALEEQYLLDAGAGNKVTVTFGSGVVIGSNDYLFLYDGNESVDPILAKYTGQSVATATEVTSSGRYMFLRFSSWALGGGSAGWNINITHSPQ